MNTGFRKPAPTRLILAGLDTLIGRNGTMSEGGPRALGIGVFLGSSIRIRTRGVKHKS